MRAVMKVSEEHPLHPLMAGMAPPLREIMDPSLLHKGLDDIASTKADPGFLDLTLGFYSRFFSEMRALT